MSGKSVPAIDWGDQCSRDSLVAENQKLCLEMLRIQISENPTSAKDTVTKLRGVATGVVIAVIFKQKTTKTMQKTEPNNDFSSRKSGVGLHWMKGLVEQETQKSFWPAVTWDYPFDPT